MIGLFCTVILGTQKKAEDFEILDFEKPEDCLGKTLLAVLSLGDTASWSLEDATDLVNKISGRMQARTKESLWLGDNGTWVTAPKDPK